MTRKKVISTGQNLPIKSFDRMYRTYITYHSNNNDKLIPVLLVRELNCKTVGSLLILNR